MGYQYQNAYDEAKKANLQRYNQILGQYQGLQQQQQQAYAPILQGYQQRYNDVLGSLAGYGQSQTQALNRNYNQLGAQQQQSLMSRGLGGTTVLDSAQRGNENDRQRALIQLNDALTAQKLGYQANLSGDYLQAQQGALGQQLGISQSMLGFEAGRQDPYPDATLYAGLMKGLGGGIAGGINDYARLANNNSPYGSLYGRLGASSASPWSWGGAATGGSSSNFTGV